MEIDWRLIWPLIGAFVLGMLVTGPGMWSEKWGFRFMERFLGRRRGGGDPKPPP
ncbi:MAG: hypothetical protein QM704_21610 [Anaeromyxobacteraceae bacterium]